MTMKKTIAILVLTIAGSFGIFAQFSTTNALPGEIEFGGLFRFEYAMDELSKLFNVRICSENNAPLSPLPFLVFESMTFTDATFEEVIGTYFDKVTNHVWRYEGQTDTIYVHPATNAISMVRVGPISVTNLSLRAFFNSDDVLGLKEHGVDFVEYRVDWTSEFWTSPKISLEMDESYLWEVLDAITEQESFFKSWQITPGYDESKNPRRRLQFNRRDYRTKQE